MAAHSTIKWLAQIESHNWSTRADNDALIHRIRNTNTFTRSRCPVYYPMRVRVSNAGNDNTYSSINKRFARLSSSLLPWLENKCAVIADVHVYRQESVTGAGYLVYHGVYAPANGHTIVQYDYQAKELIGDAETRISLNESLIVIQSISWSRISSRRTNSQQIIKEMGLQRHTCITCLYCHILNKQSKGSELFVEIFLWNYATSFFEQTLILPQCVWQWETFNGPPWSFSCCCKNEIYWFMNRSDTICKLPPSYNLNSAGNVVKQQTKTLPCPVRSNTCPCVFMIYE